MKILEEIPAPGLATAKDMAGILRWPGRNHPRAGRWLRERYVQEFARCADPMFGAGALWDGFSDADKHPVCLAACDVEGREGIPQGDARTWRPRARVELTMFSPPFLQSHSSGATEHQKQIRESRGLHAMQEFGAAPGNLGRLDSAGFYIAMFRVYQHIRTYTTDRMIVLLRNRIHKAAEVDVVGQHVFLMQEAGWEIEGAHPRRLQPTGYQQWKVAKDPSTPWIKTEYAVVAVPA